MRRVLMVLAAVILMSGCMVRAQETPIRETPVLQPVESSALKAVGYDSATQILTVIFKKSGARYDYKQVPQKVFKNLMTAPSKGSYFMKNIKGKYESTRKG